MAEISIDDCTIKDIVPNLGAKLIMIETPNTADNSDTIAVTLADYGMTTLLMVLANYHSTEDSIMVNVAVTTSVTAGVATITLDATAGSNKKRVLILVGK